MLFLCLGLIENENDKRYFSLYYEKFNLEVMRRALYLLDNQHDAEDAVQETWFALAKWIDKVHLQDENIAKAFLLKVVKYKAIDIKRKKERETSWVDYFEANEEIEERPKEYNSDLVLFSICEKDDVGLIVNCIQSMNEIYKDTLSLFYFYENTPKEIAEIMDVKQKTVEKRIERGRKILIDSLREKGKEYDEKPV